MFRTAVAFVSLTLLVAASASAPVSATNPARRRPLRRSRRPTASDPGYVRKPARCSLESIIDERPRAERLP